MAPHGVAREHGRDGRGGGGAVPCARTQDRNAEFTARRFGRHLVFGPRCDCRLDPAVHGCNGPFESPGASPMPDWPTAGDVRDHSWRHAGVSSQRLWSGRTHCPGLRHGSGLAAGTLRDGGAGFRTPSRPWSSPGRGALPCSDSQTQSPHRARCGCIRVQPLLVPPLEPLGLHQGRQLHAAFDLTGADAVPRPLLHGASAAPPGGMPQALPTIGSAASSRLRSAASTVRPAWPASGRA